MPAIAKKRHISNGTSKSVKTTVATAYFDAIGTLATKAGSVTPKNTLVKNALVIIEGVHKDNKGNIHKFSRPKIEAFIENTNEALSQGYEVPLMVDHSKQLLDGGELKKLGWVVSPLKGKTITETDLPRPEMRHLLGKFGAFTKVEIVRRIDDIQDGLFWSLSPGVNLEKERIAEISLVAFAAIHGPALFASAQFSLNYDELKEQAEAINKQKNQVDEKVAILFTAVRNIDNAGFEQLMGNDPKALKRSAVDSFVKDLLGIVGLDDDTVPQGVVTVPNKDNETKYSQEDLEDDEDEDNELDEEDEEDEEEPEVKSKRAFTMADTANLVYQ